MNTHAVSSGVFETIASEHKELDAVVQRMRTTLANDPEHLAKMATFLSEVAALLREHFAHEEEGGYFSELLEVAPRFSDDVERLRREHQILLDTAEQSAHDVRYANDSVVWWHAIHFDFEEFIRKCHEHEMAENRLIQEAWCRDIGMAD